MAEYFAYEAEMPAGEFRESMFSRKSRLRTAAVRMPRHNSGLASTRTISAVLKYRCNEQRQSRYSMTRKWYSFPFSDSLPCTFVHKSLCR